MTIPYVLVVEDEDALSALLQYNLDKEGYRVAIACRMAVNSYRQQRTVQWDAAQEQIV